MATLIDIKTQLTEEQNFNNLLQAVLPNNVYLSGAIIGVPRDIPNPNNPYFNTAIKIKFADEVGSGHDYYYHRVNLHIMTKRIEVNGKLYEAYMKPLTHYTSQDINTDAKIKTAICRDLGLLESEFTLTNESTRIQIKGYSLEYRHLVAKENSRLYTGDLWFSYGIVLKYPYLRGFRDPFTDTRPYPDNRGFEFVVDPE